MTKGKVSVILNSYNRPKYLKQAIESVINQTYKNFELLIMDDNSDIEEVWNVIKEYLSDDRVHCFNSKVSEEERKTTGCRYAVLINEAIKTIDGEFITYLTDDDYFLPNRLEKMIEKFNSTPEASIVYGCQRKLYIDTEGKTIREEIRSASGILDSAAFCVDHNSVMHRVSCFEKTGPWGTEDLRCGDAAFWRKLNANGYKFYPIPEILDVKRYHPYTISDKLDRGEEPLSGIREV